MPFNFGSLFNFGNSRNNNRYSFQGNQNNIQPNMNNGWNNNYGYNQNSQGNPPFQMPQQMLPYGYNQRQFEGSNQLRPNTNLFQSNQANRFNNQNNMNNQNNQGNQNNQQGAFNNKASHFNNQMNFLNNPQPSNQANFLNNPQPNNQMNFLNNNQHKNQFNAPRNPQAGNLMNGFNPNQIQNQMQGQLPNHLPSNQQTPPQKLAPFQQPSTDQVKEIKMPQIQGSTEKREHSKKAQENSAPAIPYDKLPIFRPLDGEMPIPEKKHSRDKPTKASFDSNQLKQFIQNEKNSSKFYENMANEINDPEARRMFFSFSNKCNEHKKAYSDILTSLNNERFEPEDRKIISGIKFYDGVSLAIKEELESLKSFSTLYDSKLDSEETKNRLTQIMLDKLIRINHMQYMLI